MGEAGKHSGERDRRGVRGTQRLATTGVDLVPGEGDAQPRLVVMAGARLGEPFLILPEAELLIGREVQSDLVLDSRSVSRQHARVTREGDQVFIEDMGSSNGVDVAGRRITQRSELRNGDLIRLGTATLKFFGSESLESEYHNQLFEMATRDGLTGLHNRSYFMDSLKRMLPQHAQRGLPLTVAIIDLDYFKLINDEYGHDVGDQSLRDIADLLRLGIRDNDVLARIGGEEFGVVFADSTPERAVEVLTRMQANLLELTCGPGQPTLSFSAGVAMVKPESVPGVDISAILKSADQALYRAKDGGRDRVEVAG